MQPECVECNSELTNEEIIHGEENPDHFELCCSCCNILVADGDVMDEVLMREDNVLFAMSRLRLLKQRWLL